MQHPNRLLSLQGNRLFGDDAVVWAYFTQPGGNGRDFPPALRIPGQAARLQCGTYRFGPVVSSLSQSKVHFNLMNPQ